MPEPNVRVPQSERDNLRFQSEEHPLVSGAPLGIQEHCLQLMQRKAYEVASSFARSSAVLDLGCNDGYGTRILGDSGASSIVGVDISERALEAARDRYPDLQFLSYDGGRLDFEDGSFDLVTSFQVIEHVYDPEPYLSEIVRVLRPGGTALLTTPNRELRLDRGALPWNPFHVREYSAAELEAQLRPFFRAVQIQGLFGGPVITAIELARTRRAKLGARPERLRDVPERLAWRLHGRVGRLGASLLPKGLQRISGDLWRAGLNTQDLTYLPTRSFRRALDLLAVCTRP